MSEYNHSRYMVSWQGDVNTFDVFEVVYGQNDELIANGVDFESAKFLCTEATKLHTFHVYTLNTSTQQVSWEPITAINELDAAFRAGGKSNHDFEIVVKIEKIEE